MGALTRYVGSSIDLASRISDHLLGSSSILLQRAFEKYGHDNFKLIIILIPEATRESVLALEQYLMDTLQPEYNILRVAGSSAGVKTGPMPPGRKAKISATKMGHFHFHFVSEETRVRMSLSHGGVSVHVFDANTLELITIYPSLRATAKALNVAFLTIKRYLDTDKAYKGYLFKSSVI
jgi:hypothetical protein